MKYTQIHKLMLQDVPRTEAYKKAILGNEKFFKDKTVMDVGAGTGKLYTQKLLQFVHSFHTLYKLLI